VALLVMASSLDAHLASRRPCFVSSVIDRKEGRVLCERISRTDVARLTSRLLKKPIARSAIGFLGGLPRTRTRTRTRRSPGGL
jgi:hypothetical protein